LINHFEAFNIVSILCSLNVASNTAEKKKKKTSIFTPLNNFFNVENICRPSIPKNIAKWRVSIDDDKIIYFLTNVGSFKETTISDEEHD
jgi:hypothetical protein